MLPEHLRTEVQTLAKSIHFVAKEHSGAGPTADLLAQLRRAIVKRQTVRP